MSESRVVVVGGGLAGHRVAHRLQHDVHVILVDPKDYFEVPMAPPRLLVDDDLEERAHLSFASFLPEVQHLAGRAVGLGPDAVAVDRGEGVRQLVPFDHLVIATGSTYVDPRIKVDGADQQARREALAEARSRVQSARRILVVGGGPVGVELAAELAAAGLGDRVVLVHGGERLLPSLPVAAGRRAARWLADRGVAVHTGRRLAARPRLDGPGEADLGDGVVVPYDLALWCAGARPATEWLRRDDRVQRDDQGRIRVSSTLTLPDAPRICVVGDAASLDAVPMGRYAGRHVDVAVHNLRVALGLQDGPVRTYTPDEGPPAMLVTLGPEHGTGHVPWMGWLARWITPRMKGRDMMVGRYRAGVGLD